MIAAILDPAFNGADLVMCVLALAVVYLGERYDQKRNQR